MELNDDVGARVKAARAYARLEPGDLAERVSGAGFRFSRRTLDRLEAGERHLDVREARVIAEACGVPLTFLVRGWWTQPDLPDRIAALEEAVKTAKEDRQLLATEIEALNETLEKRFAALSERALAQGLRPERGGRRSARGGRQAP